MSKRSSSCQLCQGDFSMANCIKVVPLWPTVSKRSLFAHLRQIDPSLANCNNLQFLPEQGKAGLDSGIHVQVAVALFMAGGRITRCLAPSFSFGSLVVLGQHFSFPFQSIIYCPLEKSEAMRDDRTLINWCTKRCSPHPPQSSN